MVNNKFVQQFNAYSDWRSGLIGRIEEYRRWLTQEELNDAQIEQRLQQVLERLAEDKLNVAFVAEFSRGKSELINAIFFANYGKRLLPSSAGRTTMCPTELMYDKSKPGSITLLPIETRLSDVTTSEYKRYPDEWTTITFNINDNDSMVAAFTEVSRTKTVTPEEAEKLGLFDPQSSDDAMTVNKDGLIEIPCWRYA